jgi:hypothetical protein
MLHTLLEFLPLLFYVFATFLYIKDLHALRSRCSSVSIVTRVWAGRLEFNSWQGQWWHLFPSHRTQTGYGAYPASWA